MFLDHRDKDIAMVHRKENICVRDEIEGQVREVHVRYHRDHWAELEEEETRDEEGSRGRVANEGIS